MFSVIIKENFLATILAMVVLFLLPINEVSSATTDWETDFDDFSTGSIHNQFDWTSSGTPVEISDLGGGDYYLDADISSSQAIYDPTTFLNDVHSTAKFSVYFDSDGAKKWRMWFGDDVGLQVLLLEFQDTSSGQIQLIGRRAVSPFDTISPVLATGLSGTSFDIEIELQNTTEIRFNVDGNGWSEWVTQYSGWGSGSDEFERLSIVQTGSGGTVNDLRMTFIGASTVPSNNAIAITIPSVPYATITDFNNWGIQFSTATSSAEYIPVVRLTDVSTSTIDNCIGFWTCSNVTTEVGAWWIGQFTDAETIISKSTPLLGEYFVRADLLYMGTGLVVASSTTFSFTVDPNAIQSATSSSIVGDILRPKCDTLDMGCYMQNAISWAFVPENATVDKFKSLTLENSFPFSYAYDMGNIRDELIQTGSSTLSVTASTTIGTITFISAELLEDVPYSSTIKTIIGYLLWIMFAGMVYRRILKVHDNNTPV